MADESGKKRKTLAANTQQHKRVSATLRLYLPNLQST